MTFDIESPRSYMFVKLQADEEYPYCPFCMQINQVELYGETSDSHFLGAIDADDNDETVSIIGRLNKGSSE